MLPETFVTSVLKRLAREIPHLLSGTRSLSSLSLPDDLAERDDADEAFVHPTIFPFLIRSSGSDAPLAWARSLCTALNGGGSSLLGATGDPSPPCHIGQPVALGSPDGIGTAAPRICIGSRTLFEAWTSGADPVGHAVERIADDVATGVRALDRLATDWSS